MDSSPSDKSAKSRTKLPSWMIEAEDERADSISPSTNGVKTAEKSEPQQAAEESLLGAPTAAYTSESDDFCAPASLSELLGEAEVPPGFKNAAENAELDKQAEKQSTSNMVSKLNPSAEAVAQGKNSDEDTNDEAEAAKVKSDMEELEKVVSSLEFLSYLKPRLTRIRKHGCTASDLIGLYRMTSQVMLENFQRQTEIMQRSKAEYDRKLRKLQEEMLFEQSSALVTGRASKKNSYASQKLAAAAEAAGVCVSAASSQGKHPEEEAKQEDNVSEATLTALKRQMEFKDSLLLKARMEAEEAEKRCEKMAQDVTNIKARLEKDLKFKSQKAKESLFERLLPVMDSFDGALKPSAASQNADSILSGLKQIYSQLLDCCQAEGLEAIQSEGQPFDPNFHEAMGHVQTNEVPEDHVFDELRRGYLLDGKLLRAAMVRLASADPGNSK
ncbi:MAG: nucleotide exchange factor GrpE [Candidatus Bruticola sp.]